MIFNFVNMIEINDNEKAIRKKNRNIVHIDENDD